ncbi:MAG: class I SAM-dependent methyltransferase [Patescibacteria group bacterium]
MKIKGFNDTIQWYNSNAASYASSIQNIPSKDQIDDFISLLPQGALILDAGCASGRDSKIMHEKGKKVIGIDLSTELIKIAKKNNPEIQFVEGNFLHLPFEDDHFDGIWSHASLLHFESIDEVLKSLREFHRVLKTEGVIHIFVKEKKDKKFDVVTDSLSHHDRFFQYFTEDEMSEYMKKTGFKIIKLLHTSDPGGRKEVSWILILARK